MPEVHAVAAALSRLHWNVELGFELVNANVAVENDDVPEGPLVIVVTGLVVSIDHVKLGGEGSAPATLRERTLNVCEPSVNAEYAFGLVHAANAAASRLHSNVDDGSLDVKANDAVAWFVSACGVDVIVVEGGPVTLHVYEGGLGSRPHALLARTLKVWLPTARLLYEMPLAEHGEKPAPSSWH
jgi:hypothetical protein